MRFVAIDLGDKRTGIAVGDLITRLASPVTVIECPIDRAGGDDLLSLIAREIESLIGRPSPRPSSAAPSTHNTQPAPPSSWGKPTISSTTPLSTGGLIVGLPINMDGSEGQRAKLVRAWAERIAARTGWPVELFDERLTSSAADAKMARSGLTHKQKKERRDAIAAAAILQGFLDLR